VIGHTEGGLIMSSVSSRVLVCMLLHLCMYSTVYTCMEWPEWTINDPVTNWTTL
jgi:hypothetical protein